MNSPKKTLLATLKYIRSMDEWFVCREDHLNFIRNTDWGSWER